MTLTPTQLAFLHQKGVAKTLKNSLNRVRAKRSGPTNANRQAAAIRNYTRSIAPFNKSYAKYENHVEQLSNTAQRLFHNHPNFPNLNIEAHNDIRNAILELPTRNANGKPIARTNNMKMYLKLHANLPRMRENYNRDERVHKNAARALIRLSPSHAEELNFLVERFGNRVSDLGLLARQVLRNFKLSHGRRIRNIVKNRMADPHTGIGRKLALARMP